MKKLWITLALVLFGLTLAACNKDQLPKATTYAQTPTHLVIDGKVLSWDAVENVSKYKVFANDEEVATVKTTTYDFSDMTDDIITFQVMAIGGVGVEDSPKSITITYMADKDNQIELMNTYFDSTGLSMPEGFASALVSRGMTAAQAETTLTAFIDFMNGMQGGYTDVSSLKADMDALNEHLDQLQAIVYALVTTALPPVLQQSIDSIDQMIDEYTQIIQNEPNTDRQARYQSIIDSMTTSRDALQALLDTITNDADSLTLSITKNIQYVMSLEQAMSEDLVTALDNLAQLEGYANLSATDLFLIKDEIVNLLNTTMPSDQDMLVMSYLNQIMTNAMSSDQDLATQVENYASRLATQTKAELQLFIDFLDHFDQDYFNQLVTDIQKGNTSLRAADIITLNATYLNTFLDDYQDQIDAIKAVFTEEEQAYLFDTRSAFLNNGMSMGTPMSLSGIMVLSLNLNYQQAMEMESLMGKALHIVLDQITTNDALVRQLVILGGYGYEGYYGEDGMVEYFNVRTGDTYTTTGEYEMAERITRYTFLKELFIGLANLSDEMTIDEYQTLMNFAFQGLFINRIAATASNLDEIQMLQDMIQTISASDDQLTLMRDLLNAIVDEDLFGQMITMENNLYDLQKITGRDHDQYRTPAVFVTLASFYQTFMDNEHQTLVSNIVDQLFTDLSDPDFMTAFGLDETKLGDAKDQLNLLLDTLLTDSATLAAFDVNNMTEEQMNTFYAMPENWIVMLSDVFNTLFYVTTVK